MGPKLDTLSRLNEDARRQVHVPSELEEFTRGKIDRDPNEQFEDYKEQQKKLRLLTEYFSANISTALSGGATLFPNGLHLSDELDIAAVYVENRGTTASVYFSFGPNPVNQAELAVAVVKPGGYKTIAVADHVRSVSFAASAAGDNGLVAVFLTTRPWDPKTGTL